MNQCPIVDRIMLPVDKSAISTRNIESLLYRDDLLPTTKILLGKGRQYSIKA